MIRITRAVPSCMSYHAVGAPKTLPFNLTISVSFNCNSRCLTCDIWKKHVNDLTLEEYEKVFRSLGRSVFWVTLSGGEPFMRKDLGELAQTFYKHCRPEIINIPTNALLGEYVAKKTEEIAKACPDSQVVLNLSLDGVGKRHDEIRGIKGNFERFMKAYAAVRKIKQPNFTVGVHTVISKYNVKEIPEICDFVLDELKPDSYISEVAEERKEMDNVGRGFTPSASDYAEAVEYLSRRTSSQKKKGISRFTNAFRSGYYRFAKKVLESNSQPIPCMAGVASAHISPEGYVWGCCVRAESLGSLRENNYDFKRIWYSQRADEFRKSVKNRECACPLANAYYSSAVCNAPTVAGVVKRLI